MSAEITNTTHTSNVEVSRGAQVVTVQPSAAVRDAKGILATATTDTGGTITGEIRPTDRVRVLGVEMSLQQAEANGYVRRGPDGKYQDASDQEVAERVNKRLAPERVEEDLSEALEVDPVVSDTLADWSGAIKSIGANPVAVLGAIVMNPDKVPEALQLLARNHGISPAKIAQDIQFIGAQVEESLNRYLGGVGIDEPDRFWNWLYRTVPRSELASAYTAALFRADTSVFRDYAARYRTTGEGRSTRKTIKVNVGGVEVTTDEVTARRNRWIR